MTEAPLTLARVEHARRLLAEARTIDEVKDVRDKAEAIRQYTRTAGMTLDIQNYAAEIKVRAERKAGELLAERDRPTGNRFTIEGDTASRSTRPPTLEEIGISRKQSSRFQEVAAIPEPVFEEVIAETKAKAIDAMERNETAPSDAVLSTAGVTRLAARKQAEREAADVQFVIESAPDDGGRLALASVKAAYARGVLAVHRLRDLDPEQVAGSLRDGDLAAARWFVRDTRDWLDRLEAALSRGLRIIQSEMADG